jgi:2-keto-4-pentenoate hydratase/2-oxohepta-3-ene-1,7-dioic acid hydratase in catechol pathway
MRLITFSRNASSLPEIGAKINHDGTEFVIPFLELAQLHGFAPFPKDMKSFLEGGEEMMSMVKRWVASPKNSYEHFLIKTEQIVFHPPLLNAEKFLCVGKNYKTHLAELKRTNLIKELPNEPTGFIKLNSCLTGHKATVIRPKGITRLDYEPELVFVIGKRAHQVKGSEALNYVVGVTIMNDLTCRDLQLREVESGSRFWTAKNIPGFGPLGPEIITLDEIPDPYNLWMVCAVNGEERMRVNTSEQIWKISDILEHFSRFIPIEIGDMFSTGAPGGVAVGKPNAEDLFLKPGDVVTCSIEGISTLSTLIIDE